jgi:nucleotide-binding universal stress UspA family protein
MLKPIKSILFATDLTKNCQQALDFTISIATQFRAKMYLLYVIEKLPEVTDDRVKGIVGVHEWEDLVSLHKQSAQKSLLGKTPTNAVVRQAIHDFCMREGINEGVNDFQSRQIIVSYGDIVDDVITHSKENEVDLIVLGSHKNLFAKQVVGGTTKRILKKSAIPVTVVPPQDY